MKSRSSLGTWTGLVLDWDRHSPDSFAERQEQLYPIQAVYYLDERCKSLATLYARHVFLVFVFPCSLFGVLYADTVAGGKHLLRCD